MYANNGVQKSIAGNKWPNGLVQFNEMQNFRNFILFSIFTKKNTSWGLLDERIKRKKIYMIYNINKTFF